MTDLWSYSRTNGYKSGNASRKSENSELHHEEGKKVKYLESEFSSLWTLLSQRMTLREEGKCVP